jgi:hypothetical protein
MQRSRRQRLWTKQRVGLYEERALVCRREAKVDWIACRVVGNGACNLVLWGSVGSGGATGIGGINIVSVGWYARAWRCRTEPERGRGSRCRPKIAAFRRAAAP